MQLAGRPVENDLSAAGWVAEAVAAAPPDSVAGLLPAVFAGYARLPHPAVRYAGDDDVPVTWARVAEHNGRRAHPLMQWPAITGSWDYVAEDNQTPLWDDSPAEGHLPVELAGRLAELLAAHTTAPEDCWFGLWAGHLATPGAAVLAVGRRDLVLVRGPLPLAAANLVDEPAEQSANLWWPADRSWCVATDTDLMSSYVGGSAAAVAALLSAGPLEAYPAGPADPVTPDSDPVNPPPA